MKDQKCLDHNRLHSWKEFALLRFLEQSLSKDMDQGFSKLEAQLFLLITIFIHVKRLIFPLLKIATNSRQQHYTKDIIFHQAFSPSDNWNLEEIRSEDRVALKQFYVFFFILQLIFLTLAKTPNFPFLVTIHSFKLQRTELVLLNL